MHRRLEALADLSRRAGVHIIAATGLHQARHYTTTQLHGVYDHLAARLVHDLTDAPVRAGIIKVAGAYHRLDEHVRHVTAAAAEAHHAAGAPAASTSRAAPRRSRSWTCSATGTVSRPAA